MVTAYGRTVAAFAIGNAIFGFGAFSLWRAVTRKTTILDFGFAVAVYIVLILSPAMLQRYNRLRVYAAIRRLAARQLRIKHEDVGKGYRTSWNRELSDTYYSAKRVPIGL
jgi:hypothetical protein